MSLRVWLPLNGDLQNQGLSDITVTNNGATVNTSGKIGSCYSFNGSNQKITGTFSSSISSAIGSLACWVKFNSLPSSSAWFNLMQLGATGGFAACRLGMYVEYGTGINISINGSSTGANYKAYSFSTGTWYHICSVYDGTKVKLYINGVEQLNKTASVGSYTTAANMLFIGGTSSYYLNGYVDDCRYYDHALSTKEIEEIAKGLVLHYKLDQSDQNLLTKDWDLTTWNKESGISVSWDNTVGMYKVLDSSHTSSRWGIYQNITLTANTTYTFSVDGMKKDQNVNFGFAEGTSWPANAGSFTTTVSRLSKTITVGDADANCRIYLNINPVTNGSNYGYFRAPKLEIGAIATSWNSHTDNTIYDSSGYGNNGTVTGLLTVTSESPRYSCAIKFDGNSFIKKTNFQIENIWTLSCWFYSPSTSTKAWSPLIILNNTGGDSDSKFSMYYNQSTKKIQYLANGTYDISQSTTQDTWHHLVATFNGSLLTGYLDGQQVTTKTISNTELSKTNLGIGARCKGTNFSTYSDPFEGKISDVRIYATALTPEQIKELYNTSMSIDNNGNIHVRELVEL